MNIHVCAIFLVNLIITTERMLPWKKTVIVKVMDVERLRYELRV